MMKVPAKVMGGNMTRARILIIADESRIVQFLERGLTYEGFQTSVAPDGQTGLASARDNPPDLVIMEWMLPGLDGLEVCRRLKAVGDLAILMLTAKDDIQDHVSGLETGADDYLVKPFTIDELIAACAHCCAAQFPSRTQRCSGLATWRSMPARIAPIAAPSPLI